MNTIFKNEMFRDDYTFAKRSRSNRALPVSLLG